MKNQIVCISSAAWYPFPTRKHQIMSRLSDSEILYFDPPVTLIAPFKDKEAWGKLTLWLKTQPKPQSNITVYAVPPVLPFYNKLRWINRINQQMMAGFIKRKMKKHRFDDAVIWCYMPQSVDAIAQLGSSRAQGDQKIQGRPRAQGDQKAQCSPKAQGDQKVQCSPKAQGDQKVQCSLKAQGDQKVQCSPKAQSAQETKSGLRGLVYDCVDRHSAYKGMINPDVVDKMEAELAGRCDMVFSTAEGLHETLLCYNKDAMMIPNGANFELFNQAANVGISESERNISASGGDMSASGGDMLASDGSVSESDESISAFNRGVAVLAGSMSSYDRNIQVPEELQDIKGRVIGFVGMLQECIDYDLIEAIARDRPEYTVVFIGRTLPGVNIDHLKKYQNVRFLGLKPQKQLPAYLARFDACLNTFVAGDLAKDVSPLKFYEYLATGKPIITTPQPLQVMDYKDVVYLAATKEEIVAQCDAAVCEDDPALRKKRIAYGKSCSWDARVRQMEDILKEKFILL